MITCFIEMLKTVSVLIELLCLKMNHPGIGPYLMHGHTNPVIQERYKPLAAIKKEANFKDRLIEILVQM